jgi:hypothetical protein
LISLLNVCCQAHSCSLPVLRGLVNAGKRLKETSRLSRMAARISCPPALSTLYTGMRKKRGKS